MTFISISAEGPDKVLSFTLNTRMSHAIKLFYRSVFHEIDSAKMKYKAKSDFSIRRSTWLFIVLSSPSDGAFEGPLHILTETARSVVSVGDWRAEHHLHRNSLQCIYYEVNTRSCIQQRASFMLDALNGDRMNQFQWPSTWKAIVTKIIWWPDTSVFVISIRLYSIGVQM